MFLLVPAYPGSPGQKAVKRLCVRVCFSYTFLTATTANFSLGQRAACYTFMCLNKLRILYSVLYVLYNVLPLWRINYHKYIV